MKRSTFVPLSVLGIVLTVVAGRNAAASLDTVATSSDTSRANRARPPVPAQAPDSISNVLWDSLTAPANLMINAPHLSGTWVRNVVFITFKPTATQTDRQAVIALINGEVVGGNIWPMGEREYIVRIPYALSGDSISGPILRAFTALRAHPSIQTAYPISMDARNVLHDRRPTSPVPMTAPDSAPTALWDSVTAPANLLNDPPAVTGTVVRDLVYVRFRPGTTQSDRQAAIDLVHGRVIGGMAIGVQEQFYAVRIPYVLAPGDSTSGPILRAQAALSHLPTITDVLLGWMDKMRPK